MSVARLHLRDFGHEPPRQVLDLIRALATGSPPSSGALTLIEQAAHGGTDHGVVRLLPMLHDHPAMTSLPEPTQRVVRRRYLKARARFVALEAAAHRIVEAMESENIPVLFLKGFALASSAYARPAHRPMGDVDMAVPHQHYARSIEILRKVGFSAVVRERSWDTLIAGVGAHALPFINEEARASLDLHHNILNCSVWSGSDDGFWREAVPLGQSGLAPALTLVPEHHVLHACVHGYSRSLLQLSIRWMIDAHLLLAKAPESFRWRLVEEEAQRHRCGPLIAAALGYLADNLGSPVPDEQLDRLAAQPMPGFDMAYFRDNAAFNEKSGFWLRMRVAWNACQRQAGRRFWTPLPFARQMVRRWGVTSPVGLVVSGLGRVRERRYVKEKRRRAITAGPTNDEGPR